MPIPPRPRRTARTSADSLTALVPPFMAALRGMERRAAAAARAALACARRGEFDQAVGHYLDLAREQRFIAQQRARGISLALAAAAECSLARGHRSKAKVLVRPLRLEDEDLIRADQGLHDLLGVSRRRLEAMGMHPRSAVVRTGAPGTGRPRPRSKHRTRTR